MSQFFQFEADFASTLRCIPMLVRYKLDTCGVKLKLHHWSHLTPDERQTLLDAPCSTAPEIQAYRSLTHHLVAAHLDEVPSDLPIDDHPDWDDSTQIPASVQEQGRTVGTQLTSEQWAGLSHLQRFALIKLSRSSHENKNFLPALQEFHLV
ncbi:MAG TPA: nitrate reductase associated protein [Coleofasciculaceae cyanobacterium]